VPVSDESAAGGGQGAEAPGGVQQGLVPRNRTDQRDQHSSNFHDFIKFTAKDIAKTRLQTTTLPVKSHTEVIGPISWHMKQRVGAFVPHRHGI